MLMLAVLLAVQVLAQKAVAVASVGITVSDLDRAVRFYTQVLDFQKIGEHDLGGEVAQRLFGLRQKPDAVRVAQLKIGDEQVELMQFVGTAPGRPVPPDSRSNDLWFQHIAIVVSDMELAYRRLREAKVAHVSTAPQTLPDYLPAAAGISAFYFRDPDGHNLELIHFPKGKGSPRWQGKVEGQRLKANGQPQPTVSRSPPAVFLGIDHTAIGIEDTDSSYPFWRDALGLEVGGHSENFGTEQEHLNQVFGARLYITGLHSEDGFGVEFLDYIAPPGGRAYPADSQPTDLWHWHTALKVNGLEQLLDRLVDNGFGLVSNGIVQLNNKNRAVMVRDPDGHAVLLEEAAHASKPGP
jgi:catechol 2,3-dioxygenase-like lactoylglutathione lyase family enzyme